MRYTDYGDLMDDVRYDILQKVVRGEADWAGAFPLSEAIRGLKKWFDMAGVHVDHDAGYEVNEILNNVCLAAMAGAVEIMLTILDDKHE